MTTFVEDVVAGRAALADVDDYVDRWHEGEGEGTLAEFLGLTGEEYDAWVRDADAIEDVVAARMSKEGRRHAAA